MSAKQRRTRDQLAKKPRHPAQPEPDLPIAGPHADPDLTNTELTPGAGTLPDNDEDSGRGTPGTG